ncbi:response regulator [Halonotius sp. GCM10025705]|uniref:response regulator n=1 Tax=Halonotius sp. GCM10025705 TaxID=3252678 RepID=UPI0036240034
MADPDGIDILHVDDDPEFLSVVADLLEKAESRITVQTATTTSEGIEQIEAAAPDCVVADYELPGETGIEFLQTIRETHPNLPFIMLTGRGNEDVASDAIAAGATDYLQKKTAFEHHQVLINRITNAVEQYHATRRASDLQRIRNLVNDINQALVRAESRSAAETRVCEIISDADPYRFAWIGGVDEATQEVIPRASAGIEAAYLDAITVTVDETATGRGPGGTAIRDQRVAVSQDVSDDPTFEPWRDEALERGYKAVAATPLAYEETLYGELVVYADRPNAFTKHEQQLLSELGDDIGHAIHSLELQASLREERNRHQALFANAPTPVIAVDQTDPEYHRIIDVNEAFTDVFGYSADQVIGSDVADAVVPKEGLEEHKQYRQRALAGDSIISEVKRETATGVREFLLHVIPFGTADDDPAYTFAWYTDITERKARKQELERTNTVLQTMVDNLPMGVLIEDADREIILANDQLGETLGVPIDGEELIGRDCARAAKEIQHRFAEPEQFIEKTETHLQQRDFVTNEELVLADDSVVERDYAPYTLPSGQASLWLYRDVTEQKQREQALQHQNERLEEYANIVAHDLRNPLNTAYGQLQLAQNEFDSERLSRASGSIQRGLDLVDDMLTLAQQGDDVDTLRPVALDTEATHCWETVATETGTLEIASDVTIEADPSRFRQLLENLFRNAVDHGGADVTVRVGALSDGFYVEDDGDGIPEDRRESVFEAGSSGDTDGTGFGLAIVKQIARAMEWEVAVTASDDGGARFEFRNVVTHEE